MVLPLKSKMCAPPLRLWSNDNSFPRKRDGLLGGRQVSPRRAGQGTPAAAEATGRHTSEGARIPGGRLPLPCRVLVRAEGL